MTRLPDVEIEVVVDDEVRDSFELQRTAITEKLGIEVNYITKVERIGEE